MQAGCRRVRAKATHKHRSRWLENLGQVLIAYSLFLPSSQSFHFTYPLISSSETSFRNVSIILISFRWQPPISSGDSWFLRDASSTAASSTSLCRSAFHRGIWFKFFNFFFVCLGTFWVNLISNWLFWCQVGFVLCEVHCGACEFEWTYFAEGSILFPSLPFVFRENRGIEKGRFWPFVFLYVL